MADVFGVGQLSRMWRSGPITLHSVPSVVTLVCGWMRICTWAAAAPASPSTTVASQKLTTFESWTWRLGHSAEDHATQARGAPPTHTITPSLICP